MFFFPPLVGPTLSVPKRKKKKHIAKETDALIYSMSVLENYPSKISD